MLTLRQTATVISEIFYANHGSHTFYQCSIFYPEALEFVKGKNKILHSVVFQIKFIILYGNSYSLFWRQFKSVYFWMVKVLESFFRSLYEAISTHKVDSNGFGTASQDAQINLGGYEHYWHRFHLNGNEVQNLGRPL